jgi:UDP-3-O-[3-hydroxymyristoyl] glucosamine N-acyltransferase
MKLTELAERFSCQLEGDGTIEISGVETLEHAEEGQISFLTNYKYLPEARTTKASAIIVGLDGLPFEKTILKHANPYLVFAKTLEMFSPPLPQVHSIHPSAIISDRASLGKNVSIGAFAFLGEDVAIGDDAIIEPNVVILKGVKIGRKTLIQAGAVIRQHVTIGDDCIIQSNVVLGSDGFGYARQDDGSWYKIRQTGTVILEDGIEIGAGSTIDRASLGESRIKTGAKLDNLVQVGHGSIVGENSLLCAQVGLAGSTVVGNNVILAGQVGSAGHLRIGDNVIATGQTGIPGDVEAGTIISGSPSFSNKQWLKSTAIFTRLPEINRSIRSIEKRLKELENNQVKL